MATNYTNQWLADMGYAAWRKALSQDPHASRFITTYPANFDDCDPAFRHAWLTAVAAIRRRVVNWKLPAEGEPDAD